MPDWTTRLNLRKPTLGDLVSVQHDVNEPAAVIDKELPCQVIEDNIATVSPVYQGQLVYERRKRRFSLRVDDDWIQVNSPMAQRGYAASVRIATPAIAIPNAWTLIMSATITCKQRRNYMVETSWAAFPDGGGGPHFLQLRVTANPGATPSSGAPPLFDKEVRAPALNIDREIHTIGSIWYSTDTQITVGVYAQTDGAAKTWATHGSFPAHLLIRDIGAEINYAP